MPGRIASGGENLESSHPGQGPQYETMRHWITSFRYVEDRKTVTRGDRFANVKFAAGGGIACHPPARVHAPKALTAKAAPGASWASND